jgi:hypothetical protein
MKSLARCKIGLKKQPKNFISDGIKKKNLWNSGNCALNSREITLKRNISEIAVGLPRTGPLFVSHCTVQITVYKSN